MATRTLSHTLATEIKVGLKCGMFMLCFHIEICISFKNNAISLYSPSNEEGMFIYCMLVVCDSEPLGND